MPLSQQEYIDAGGGACPQCECKDVTGYGVSSDDLTGFGLTDIGSDLHDIMSCAECGTTWVEHYKLIGYADLKE